MTDERHLPPQDLEAERSVLGAILLHNPAFDEVAGLLNAERFYADHHRRIFAAIARMYETNPRGIDAVTLAAELRKSGDFDSIGGAPYLVGLLEAVPHAAHADYYAKIVLAKWQLRELLRINQEGIRDVFSSGFDEARDLVERAEKRIFQLASSDCRGESLLIADILDETFRQIFERQESGKTIRGTSSGFSGLDELTSGFQPGNLIILAARPSMGKTALVCNFALELAKAATPVLLFSLEQAKTELAERMLCIQTRINGKKLSSNNLSEIEIHRLNEGSAKLRELPIVIDDTSGQTMTQIAGIARRQKRQRNIGMVIIDYLQLIETDDRSLPREQQIASITRRLKFLAKDLSVPVLALAQLNRGVEQREDKKPRLADLRESGAIEQDADIVMLLHRHEAYHAGEREGEADLIVAKNRNGQVGTAKLVWLAEAMKFGDAAEQITGGMF